MGKYWSHSIQHNLYSVMATRIPLILIFICIITVSHAQPTRNNEPDDASLAAPEFEMRIFDENLSGQVTAYYQGRSSLRRVPDQAQRVNDQVNLPKVFVEYNKVDYERPGVAKIVCENTTDEFYLEFVIKDSQGRRT